MVRFYLLLCLLPLASCGVYINYLGSSYAPTKNVDVYVDAASIKKPYTIVGKAYVSEHSLYTLEQLQAELVKKAMEKGADAILIQDYYLTHDGYSVNTVTRTDSINKGIR